VLAIWLSPPDYTEYLYFIDSMSDSEDEGSVYSDAGSGQNEGGSDVCLLTLFPVKHKTQSHHLH
jgi:hypothetical protein